MFGLERRGSTGRKIRQSLPGNLGRRKRRLRPESELFHVAGIATLQPTMADSMGPAHGQTLVWGGGGGI